jgi:hydrogenase expression/formation protein HypE
VLRDPTRGGLSATLNEIAQQSGGGMVISEESIPVRDEVTAACELLGLDPLHLANEGKLIAITDHRHADKLLATMRSDPLGREAAIIGHVAEDPNRFVQIKTTFGGTRILDWLVGEALPRIC